MADASACGDTHEAPGQPVACTKPPLHRGPHSGPGTGSLVGAAWCTLPCRGRLCRGPCHPGDPTTPQPDKEKGERHVRDLIDFLRARLDEDEAIARAAYGNRWDTDTADSPGDRWVLSEDMHLMEADAGTATHAARHDPARVLREVGARRRIVDRYAWLREHGDTGGAAWVLPLLAVPYAAHPGYRPEWVPRT